MSSWNFGCQLIRQGEFNLGWKLFEHGLRTPADGIQRWQRALYKPFSFNKIRLWKGESLKNQRLLLLGEQGIGDSMMFFSLIPKLIQEGAELTLIVPQRLKEIYERSLRSCEIIGAEDCKKDPPNHEKFDFQCPVGSVPQHRFKTIDDFFGRNFKIVSDKNKTLELRQKYLKSSNSNNKIIGLSWQGGGTKDRVNDKSIKLKSLLNVLKPYNFKLISLQYGDDAKIVAEHAAKQNVDFIDDPDIQATKDMNSWLNQVDSCDAVISIANTTIHGAGGLNKPTLCLLGVKADWRWLQDKNYSKSYWYPSVDIAWQDRDKSWDSALGMIEPWLRSLKMIG